MTQSKQLTDQPLTVLGLSKSGTAVARYATRRGAAVFLSEYSPASPSNENMLNTLKGLGVEIEVGGHGERCFSHSDTIILSPGIPPSAAIIEQLKLSGKTLISEVDFAYRQATQIPIIGVTGTNGKSTVTTLISQILCHSGLQAPACGNIGIPVTEVIDYSKNLDTLVVELSSYQLTFSPTLQVQIAVFTNFKPDHLDWHGSLEHYREAKMSLFTRTPNPTWSILPANDPVGAQIAAQQTDSQQCWFSCSAEQVANFPNKVYINKDQSIIIDIKGKETVSICTTDELQLIGQHNYENVLASVAAAYLSGVSAEAIRTGCIQFEGLEHRLKRINSIPKKHSLSGQPTDVLFYNDSKATNTDAAIVAMKTFGTQKVILIAGGYDKMTPLDAFCQTVIQHVATIVLIGNATQRFSAALEACGYNSIEYANTLEDAVLKSYQLSNGEPVLLSPACASFDMFKDFETRGNTFVSAVKTLLTTVQANPKKQAGTCS